MKSPTIFDQASITSVSCRRSRSPKRCISFGSTSAGACQRSGRILFSGTPRHSAITAARREGLTRSLPLARPPGLPVDVAASHLAPFIRLLFSHRRRAEQRRTMRGMEHRFFERIIEEALCKAPVFLLTRRLAQPPLQRFNALTLQPEPKAQYFRRMWLGRIFSSSRYFATVRRAIGMPRSPRISTIS